MGSIQVGALDGDADLDLDLGVATSASDPSSAERWAAWTFVAALIVAGPLLLVVGNQRWFSTDEWGLLVSYSLDDPAGLFAPQNGHWSTIPAVVFQALYEVVGLRSYAVYEAMSVGTHLLAVVCIRAIMRRAGVGAWVATLAASSLLLFGSGMQNIFVAIQISFVGAFVLGVTQVLLADHDDLGWRDAAGVVAGIGALMCSAVGVAMIPVVAVAVLLRRGVRVALLHVVPLLVVYGSWYLWQQPRTTVRPDDVGTVDVVGNVLRWDVDGFAAGLGHLAGGPVLGVLLAGVLVVGLTVAWRAISWSTFRRTQGAPVALLVGAVTFLSLTGYARWTASGSDAFADTSRYQHMVVAFTVPAIGVAVDALVRRWRASIAALGVLFVVGLVANIAVFGEASAFLGPQWDHHRDVVLGTTRSPLATQVSPNVRVDPAGAFFLDIGWLLEADRLGRLPDPTPIDPNTQAEFPVRLGFRQGLFGTNPADCEVRDEITLTPRAGQVYRITPKGAAIGVRSVDGAGDPTSPTVEFVRGQGRYFIAELADQRLEIRPAGSAAGFEICS